MVKREQAEDHSAAVHIPPGLQLRMLDQTTEMPPLPLPEEPRIAGSDIILPANPLTEMSDDLLADFIEHTMTSAASPLARAATAPIDIPPPADSPVLITDGIPIEASFDPTIPNPSAKRHAVISRPTKQHCRDIIATLLGMRPLVLTATAAPTPIDDPAESVIVAAPPVVDDPPARPSTLRMLAQAATHRWWIPATAVTTTLAAMAIWFAVA